MYPFERFSANAKQVLTLAQEEANRSHHSYIGTEHLLIALLCTHDGVAAQALAGLGVGLDAVRERTSSVLARNELTISQMIPTSRVKAVIEIAFRSAQQLGDDTVDTEHLLLALVREGQGIAAHVLEDMGATLAAVEAAVVQLRGIDAGKLPPLVASPASTPTPAEVAPALQVLMDATNLARGRGEPLSSEHVLLAVSRSSQGRAAEILASHGLTPEVIEQLLDPSQ